MKIHSNISTHFQQSFFYSAVVFNIKSLLCISLIKNYLTDNTIFKHLSVCFPRISVLKNTKMGLIRTETISNTFPSYSAYSTLQTEPQYEIKGGNSQKSVKNRQFLQIFDINRRL